MGEKKDPLSWQEASHLWQDLSHKFIDHSAYFMRDVAKNFQDHPTPFLTSPFHVGEVFKQAWFALLEEPVTLLEAQKTYIEKMNQLFQATYEKASHGEYSQASPEKVEDKRFRDAAWHANPYFDFIRQAYLLTNTTLLESLGHLKGVDDKTKQKINFYMRQYLDAMSPTNFAWTNPQVIRRTIETGGQNLLKGFENFLDDLKQGKGNLSIKMSNPNAFNLGKNLAMTPGKVVFQNDLLQLIQYEPTTENVYQKPILITPPWINKFYIFDLREHNSMVKWLVDQGFTVFIISWVNPDEALAYKSFDDYREEGLFQAIKTIKTITGQPVHVAGYCIGGVLLSCLLAWLGKEAKEWVESASYFATIIDYEHAGDLTIFVDEEQLKDLEERMAKKGYLEGSAMAMTFNMLRANDLIWSFFINNYLLAEEPFPFDLLYWNGDCTRMPATMHSFYLRQLYLNNALAKPGGITLGGREIDLRVIDRPSFILAAHDDHIAPWLCCYEATKYYQGDNTFVLVGSGHVAGIINPPEAHKYMYWINPDLSKAPHSWLQQATEKPGSWWLEWRTWLIHQSDKKVLARDPSKGPFPVLEEAPGSYVMVKE